MSIFVILKFCLIVLILKLVPIWGIERPFLYRQWL